MENINQFKKTFEKRNFYTTKDSGKVFLYALIFPFVVGLVVSYVAMAVASATGVTVTKGENLLEVMLSKYLWFAVPFVMLTQIVFICLYFCYHKANRIKISACNLSLKKANIWTCLLSALTGIICVGGFLLLVEGCFTKMFDVLGLESSSTPLPFDSVGWLFLNLLLMGVVPAICEELLFRGVILQGLRERFSPVVRVILTGLLFALMHQSVTQLFYPFILGCVLSVVMEKTNNLLYPILVHMFNNFTTLILYYFLQNQTFVVTWWFVLLAIAVAALTCVILWILYRFYLKKHTKIEVEQTGELTQTQPMSVGKFPMSLICGVLLAIIFIVINAVG